MIHTRVRQGNSQSLKQRGGLSGRLGISGIDRWLMNYIVNWDALYLCTVLQFDSYQINNNNDFICMILYSID